MPALYPNQDTFVRGEISPRLHARASIDLYKAGLAKCYNFLTLPHGGIRKRGGTYFVGSTKYSDKKTRLIPFIFSAPQAYCIELGDLYLRIYAYGARVGTVELVTPWPEGELNRIMFYQSADQMWLAHPEYALQVLTRTGHTSWTLGEYEIEDGPYLEINTTGTTLKPGSYGSSVPTMTSNTAPSGTVDGANNVSTAFEVFDRNEETAWAADIGAGYVSYTFGGGGEKTVDAYAIRAYTAGEFTYLAMPSVWKFEGFDGSVWVTLDSRAGESGWVSGEKRFYEFRNTTPFEAYRLNWSATYAASSDAEKIDMAEVSLNQAGDEQIPFTLVASSTTGINDDAGFLPSDVGRVLRLQGSDGIWRWARIAVWTSATVVTIRLYGHALPDLSPIANWRLGAFATGQQAGAVSVYEERLALSRRFSLYASKTFDLENFAPGEADDDGMEFMNAGGGQANDIVWIADGDGYLLLATTGGIRALSGSGVDEALTPSSFKNRHSRTHGAARIAPADAGSSFLYVSRSRRQLIELTMNQYGRFSSEDIGQISEHIPKQGVSVIAYQDNPDPVLWFVLDTGELGGFTHQPSEEVRGMYHFRTGEPRGETATGTADADAFESVCVTPGADGLNDDVWVVVQRTINGDQKRFIELLTAPLEGPTTKDTSSPNGRPITIMDSFVLDCGLTYSGAATGTVTGLSHLNGEAVSVLAGSRVYHDLVVDDGAVTLPGGVTASKWHVGLAWGAVADTLELDVGGRDGSLLGRRKKIAKVILSLYETDISGLTIRSLQRGVYETVRLPSIAVDYGTVTLFTGNVEVPIDDSWEGRGKIQIAHTSPTPCTIRAMTPVFDHEP